MEQNSNTLNILTELLSVFNENENDLNDIPFSFVIDFIKKGIAEEKRRLKLDEDSYIQSFETQHTGGNIYNDVITLKDGTIIRIGEGTVIVYKDKYDDEESLDDIGTIYY